MAEVAEAEASGSPAGDLGHRFVVGAELGVLFETVASEPLGTEGRLVDLEDFAEETGSHKGEAPDARAEGGVS